MDAEPEPGQERVDGLSEIEEELAAFYRARDWEQFHSLKDLAAGISIEAGELQQLFLWRGAADSDEILAERRGDVEAEFADVFIHCLSFARRANLDIKAVVRRKLAANEAKFPVDEVKGRVVAHDTESTRAL